MTLNKKRDKISQLDEAARAKRKEEKVVNSCCSFQSRLGPPEYRKWRRVHGLQRPLHPQQVVGWFVLLGLGSATFLILLPALTSSLRDCLLIILSSLFFLHVVSHLAALLLDPADPQVRALKVTIAVPEFDRTKHAHVIENGRCHLCNIKTSGPRTKHCSVCNKCVEHFDHHCKWLNHCVGGRNYVAFLVCVISAVAASVVVVVVSIIELFYYHVDPSCLSFSNSTSFLPEPVFVGVVSLLGILSATTAGLLLHLCLFHCYIAVLGITTYEYIRHYRQGTTATPAVAHKCNLTSKSDPSDTQIKPSCCQCCPIGTKLCPCVYSKEPNGIQSIFRLSRRSENVESGKRVEETDKPYFISISEKIQENSERTSSVGDSENRSLSGDLTKTKVNPDLIRTPKCFSVCLKMCSKSTINISHREHIKIKCNQIRPTTEEEINKALEKIATMSKSENLETVQVKTGELPALAPPTRRLKNLTELREIENAFEEIDRVRPNPSVHQLRPVYRRSRKKNLIRRPLSPSLSPIRESGLSNPGSPRIDIITDELKQTSPQVSTIFLSNSPSPVSSEEDLQIKLPSETRVVLRSDDVLETPQLPRKCYSPKNEQIYVVKTKHKVAVWNTIEPNQASVSS